MKAVLILITLPSYPGVIGRPGDPSGCPKVDSPGDANGLGPNVERPGEAIVWPPKVVTPGDMGSFKLRGVGPFGNSHWVD